MAEGLQGAQVFGLDDRSVGQSLLKSGENFDALDRVNAKIAIEAHGEFEHLGGVAGFVGDDGEEDGRDFG